MHRFKLIEFNDVILGLLSESLFILAMAFEDSFELVAQARIHFFITAHILTNQPLVKLEGTNTMF